MILLWGPLAPADRWDLLDPHTRALALRVARKGLAEVSAQDGWYRPLWPTERVRQGRLPGYRKPWAYLEVRAYGTTEAAEG